MYMADKNLKVVDLFSGCGGLSKGFIDAGYEVVLGVDNDKAALETFRLNHGNANALDINLSIGALIFSVIFFSPFGLR